LPKKAIAFKKIISGFGISDSEKLYFQVQVQVQVQIFFPHKEFQVPRARLGRREFQNIFSMLSCF
jgi:hypothetical protein